MPSRLLIADSQPVVRAGLHSFFLNTDAQIVDDAHSVEQLLEKATRIAPDAILTSDRFEDGDCFDAIALLRKRRFRGGIAILARDARVFELARARAVGADSYILATTPRSELLDCVRALCKLSFLEDAERERAAELCARELVRVSSQMRYRATDPLNPLTGRELQVLRHVALGLTNKEIALSLRISVDTVKEHVQNVLRKLEVNDRAQAAVWAVRNKLIP